MKAVGQIRTRTDGEVGGRVATSTAGSEGLPTLAGIVESGGLVEQASDLHYTGEMPASISSTDCGPAVRARRDEPGPRVEGPGGR